VSLVFSTLNDTRAPSERPIQFLCISLIDSGQVYRRPMKQWVLKITEYADRLLEDLDELDWPESIN
jgi:hypothetical protein